jgi:ABC-2 type transport system permease protein
MTAQLIAQRPRSAGGSEYTGTGQLLRLYLRRDRIVLPLWAYLLGAMPPITAESIKKLYTTPEQLANFTHTTNASSSLLAMYGPVWNTSLGAVGVWKAAMMYPVIGLATILTVIRHTRTEEETGRAELIGSTRVGRYAGLTAALALAAAGSVIAGVICVLGLLALKFPVDGSMAFGLALAGSGLLWACVAGIAAQVSTGARTARGIALAALATAFILRAIGDARGNALSWLSPLGWCIQLRPYARERWWVLGLLACAATLTCAAGYVLRYRRDVGTGLLAERLGASTAGTSLSGPLGLAWRQQRGAMLAWAIGIGLYGVLIGGSAKGVSGLLGTGRAVRDTFARLGGSAGLEQEYLGTAFMILGIIAAAYAISATLRLHEEETSQRAEPTLAGAVSRTRWALGHLLFAVLGPAVALLGSGLLAGIIYGTAVDDLGTQLPKVLGAAAVQLPAAWLMSGIAMACFGVAPRYCPAAWGVLSGLVAIYVLGSTGSGPQWLLDVTPFTHTPKIAAFTWTPVLWMLGIAVSLWGIGIAGLRRRDL